MKANNPNNTYSRLTLLQRLKRDLKESEDLRLKEQALKETEKKFYQAIESYPDPFVIYNSKRKIIYINKKGIKNLAMSSEEIVGKRDEELYPEEISSVNVENLRKVIRTGKSKKAEVLVNKNGHFYAALEHFIPIKDKKNKVISVHRIVHDISHRKKMENTMSYLSEIVQLSTDAIIGEDLNGNITAWNKGAEKMFGYKAKEVIGKNIWIIVPKERRLYQRRALDNVRVGPHDSWRKRKNGEIFPVSVNHSVIKSDGKIIGVATINRDISKERELSKRKDEFVSIASHELKTPVTSLKAYVQILINRLEYLNDRASLEFVKKMRDQVNRINTLVSDLLDVTKIESGQLILTRDYFYIDSMVEEVIKEIQSFTFNSHNLIFSKRCGIKVKGDRFRLSQVLINLLTNAIKNSPPNSKIIISCEKKKENITVSIRDFGVGIPEKDLKRIFERFFQVRDGKTKRISGTGLGLYIASQIIKRHGGEMRVKSQEGKGTTFYFTLKT